jgi:hypothetical protein
MRGTKLYAMLAAMFMAGAFLASPELRAYAANTIRSTDIVDGQVMTADLANNAVTSAKIKDGEVKAADIAGSAVNSAKIAAGGVVNSDIANNAVTSSKIADGTIVYGDVSRNLVVVEHRNDCNCGGTGWDPNGTSATEQIFDQRITPNSVVVVTAVDAQISCATSMIPVVSDGVWVVCSGNIPSGMGINYAIFSNPAYG